MLEHQAERVVSAELELVLRQQHSDGERRGGQRGGNLHGRQRPQVRNEKDADEETGVALPHVGVSRPSEVSTAAPAAHVQPPVFRRLFHLNKNYADQKKPRLSATARRESTAKQLIPLDAAVPGHGDAAASPEEDAAATLPSPEGKQEAACGQAAPAVAIRQRGQHPQLQRLHEPPPEVSRGSVSYRPAVVHNWELMWPVVRPLGGRPLSGRRMILVPLGRGKDL